MPRCPTYPSAPLLCSRRALSSRFCRENWGGEERPIVEFLLCVAGTAVLLLLLLLATAVVYSSAEHLQVCAGAVRAQGNMILFFFLRLAQQRMCVCERRRYSTIHFPEKWCTQKVRAATLVCCSPVPGTCLHGIFLQHKITK